MVLHHPIPSLEVLLLWNVVATVMLWFLLRFLFTWLASVLFNHPPRNHP